MCFGSVCAGDKGGGGCNRTSRIRRHIYNNNNSASEFFEVAEVGGRPFLHPLIQSSLVALSMALCVHMFTNVSTMYARIYYNTFNETHHSAHSPASQQLRYNDNEKLVRVRFF